MNNKDFEKQVRREVARMLRRLPINERAMPRDVIDHAVSRITATADRLAGSVAETRSAMQAEIDGLRRRIELESEYASLAASIDRRRGTAEGVHLAAAKAMEAGQRELAEQLIELAESDEYDDDEATNVPLIWERNETTEVSR